MQDHNRWAGGIGEQVSGTGGCGHLQPLTVTLDSEDAADLHPESPGLSLSRLVGPTASGLSGPTPARFARNEIRVAVTKRGGSGEWIGRNATGCRIDHQTSRRVERGGFAVLGSMAVEGPTSDRRLGVRRPVGPPSHHAATGLAPSLETRTLVQQIVAPLLGSDREETVAAHHGLLTASAGISPHRSRQSPGLPGVAGDIAAGRRIDQRRLDAPAHSEQAGSASGHPSGWSCVR